MQSQDHFTSSFDQQIALFEVNRLRAVEEIKPKTSNEPRRPIKCLQNNLIMSDRSRAEQNHRNFLELKPVHAVIPSPVVNLLANDPLMPSPISMHPSFGPIKTPLRFTFHNSSSNLSRQETDKPYGSPTIKTKIMVKLGRSNSDLDVYQMPPNPSAV